MTKNQEILAEIQASVAISKAKTAHLPAPEIVVMGALQEAIEERRSYMAHLALHGRVDSTEYQNAQRQLLKWDAAWRGNR